MTLISFSHQFAFIKTYKTAGTSLEVHLSRMMSKDDIVTPISPPNRDHIPRNYVQGEGNVFVNHMPASLIKRILGHAYQSLFTFCFERHPIDKCLSYFAMTQNGVGEHWEKTAATWEEYVEQGDFPVDTRLYVGTEGELLVDRIFRYEEMSDALQEICDVTGMQLPPLTSREKSGYRVGVPTFGDVAGTKWQYDRIMTAFESSLAFTAY
ncbi:hypothetical protein [Novosphingobium sp. YAF33]|uniref:hypothetical protein n=1 Tax=Novosphingobium sp. YAF33 TaxID=3233082 RepID=UPI003F9D488A